jgi:hypothetical protein
VNPFLPQTEGLQQASRLLLLVAFYHLLANDTVYLLLTKCRISFCGLWDCLFIGFVLFINRFVLLIRLRLRLFLFFQLRFELAAFFGLLWLFLFLGFGLVCLMSTEVGFAEGAAEDLFAVDKDGVFFGVVAFESSQSFFAEGAKSVLLAPDEDGALVVGIVVAPIHC